MVTPKVSVAPSHALAEHMVTTGKLGDLCRLEARSRLRWPDQPWAPTEPDVVCGREGFLNRRAFFVPKEIVREHCVTSSFLLTRGLVREDGRPIRPMGMGGHADGARSPERKPEAWG